MPNWCENELLVRAATPERQQQVLAEIKGEDLDVLDFNMIVPRPEWIDMYDWEWRADKWGTNRNACNQTMMGRHDKAGGTWLRFDTAWTPPLPVVHALSAKYPDVLFTLCYWECGCQFRGALKMLGGKVLLEREHKYHGNRGG